MSPLMLEKYVDAAEAILEGAYPTQPTKTVAIQPKEIRGNNNSNGEFLSFNNPPEITYTYRNNTPGSFRVVVRLEVVGLSEKDKKQITDVLAALKKADEEKAAAQEAGAQEPAASCHLLEEVLVEMAPSNSPSRSPERTLWQQFNRGLSRK